VAGFIGYRYGGMRLALLSGVSFLAIALFKQWDSAMLTLALILVCVPICVVSGLLIGIWGYLSPRANRIIITPMLDLMQTMPTFAYLIPMLLLFGSRPVSALLATGLFATPPMVRATVLGLQKVPQDIKDFADMAGCTRRQKLWRVLVPSAKPSLMLGVNQVIMLALNMVIISSMIGAGGLGYDVLLALRALNVGQAMEAGLAIVILAIVLDRVSRSPKPFTVCLIGGAADGSMPANARLAGTLTEAAVSVLGRKLDAYRGPLPKPGGGRLIRGLFCGGTLCSEAQLILQRAGQAVVSNAPIPGVGALGTAGNAHILIDLGDDQFTRGRPHPMIEPATRDAPLAEALADRSVGVVLLDVILGWGAHADPAGQLVRGLGTRRADGPAIVASVTGTEADPQVRSAQVRRLTQAVMMARSGNMHIFPMNPVNVIRWL